MITLRRSSERGRTKLNWLDSRHTFSFGDYYDPQHMAFRELRVINEDRVNPGAGFPTHSHRDMEIITYVMEGGASRDDFSWCRRYARSRRRRSQSSQTEARQTSRQNVTCRREARNGRVNQS